MKRAATKRAATCLAGLVLLGGCSAPSLALYLEPPQGDESCIGVVGFEVEVFSRKSGSRSASVLNTGPVLTPETCRMSRPFTVEDLDPDEGATINVTGYDGARAARVAGSTTVKDLRSGTGHITLSIVGTPPPAPIVVVNRVLLLEGAPLSEVSSMVLSIAMMGQTQLVSADMAHAGPYFSVEPAAYASSVLLPDGMSQGLNAVAMFGVEAGTLNKRKLNLVWHKPYYEVQP